MRRLLSTLASATVLLVLAAAPGAGQNGHDLYQQALRKERAEGDLPGAIALYRQVVATGDRTLAAQALLRIGESYEKLGRADAREAYQRLLRDFADQTEPARAARARLAAIERSAPPPAARAVAAAPTGLTVRLVWEGAEPGIDIEGRPTPDGRQLTFVDWYSGDLALRDLETGKHRRLTNIGYPQYALQSSVSPDGQLAAYFWTPNEWQPQLRVIGTDGSNPRVLIENASREIDYLTPLDWTPDGRHVLVSFWMTDRTARIGLVSTTDGSIRIVRSLDWRRPMRASLSPDGRYIVYDLPPDTLARQRDIFLLAADGSREIPLVQHPANDLHPIWTPEGTHVVFSSDRGGSIDLWALRVADGRPQGEPQLVKRDMAHNFFWPMGFTRDGTFFFAKDTGGGDIYVAPFDPESGRATGEPRRVVESFVGYNTAPHLSADGQRLAYVTRRRAMSAGQGAWLVVRDMASGREVLLEDLRMHRKWSRPRVSPDGNSAIVVGDPARGVRGIFVVDLGTGEHRALVQHGEDGELDTGRSTAEWTPDGRAVIYAAVRRSADGRRSDAIVRRDLATGQEEALVSEIGLRGWTSVWAVAPDEQHVAYGGFDRDGTFRILLAPVTGGEPRELLSLQQHDIQVAQFVGLAWTPDGRYLLFGRSEGVWDGEEPIELWRVPAAGGIAEPTGLAMKDVRHLSVTADGRNLLFAAGDLVYHEVWTMENLLAQLRGAR